MIEYLAHDQIYIFSTETVDPCHSDLFVFDYFILNTQIDLNHKSLQHTFIGVLLLTRKETARLFGNGMLIYENSRFSLSCRRGFGSSLRHSFTGTS